MASPKPLKLTDADFGAASSHRHIDGWWVDLATDGQYAFFRDREGASSVSGWREWGTYDLQEGRLSFSARKARHYCNMGDPDDPSGLGDEWDPTEPSDGRMMEGC